MNCVGLDQALARQRCRQWMPLLTQQLRLRHLHQIIAYNFPVQPKCSIYYTLHLSAMCAPFYTSEKTNSSNPKWSELNTDVLPYPSASAFVLRVWCVEESEMDTVLLSWGINLSGLVYMGSKLSEIQPECFKEKSVILHLHGGYFTVHTVLRTDLPKHLPFIDSLNVISDKAHTNVYRNTVIRCPKHEAKTSYRTSVLQQLHSIQIRIRNVSLDLDAVKRDVTSKCPPHEVSTPDMSQETGDFSREVAIERHPSQLLTMNTLNKMLHGQNKPTKIQKLQIGRISKKIELAKSRTRMLSHERDKKCAHLRQLQHTCTALADQNEEKGSSIMEKYRTLSRDSEKLREWKQELVQSKETLHQSSTQFLHRRRQLMSQLLHIYPIEQFGESKFKINGVYLPNSELLSSSSSDGSLSVALGYVAHILMMCDNFLQVPLKYPITFMGSRSLISDHITSLLTDKNRDFPLFTKGKDRMQFNYAVYLLNKNIAQLRWLCGQNTPDLRETLPNLFSFLQNRKLLSLATCSPHAKVASSDSLDSAGTVPQIKIAPNHNETHLVSSAAPLDNLLRECRNRNRMESKDVRSKREDSASESSQAELAISEAFMNKQISPSTFKTYMKEKVQKSGSWVDLDTVSPEKADNHLTIATKVCDEDDRKPVNNSTVTPLLYGDVEQATDILQSCMDDTSIPTQDVHQKKAKQKRRISRSVGSISENLNLLDAQTSLELGSDPVLNAGSETNEVFVDTQLVGRLEDGQQEFLQKWLDSAPALVCSEESLYPDEALATVPHANEIEGSPLRIRADALMSNTSFNLIKPK